MALTDEAIEKIKSMIVSGTLRAGDRLPKEADLAAELGLSRSSLREAVQALSLVNILDPNRVIGQPYFIHTVEQKDGRVETGLLAAEDETAIKLKNENDAIKVILKKDIEQKVEAGTIAEMKFTARATGRFPIHLHDARERVLAEDLTCPSTS